MKKARRTDSACELLDRQQQQRHHAEHSEVLHMLLRCGVSSYLLVEELVAVLNCCTLLRNDRELALHCASGMPDFAWFPTVLTELSATPSTNRRLHDLWAKRGVLDTPAHSELRTQVLSLAALLKKRIQRWCFVHETLRPEEEGDVLCSVRPALIPVNGLGMQQSGIENESDALRNQLNAMTFGFGDAFTTTSHGDNRGGWRFGAHWENIHTDQRSGRVSCSLCAAAKYAVGFYKRQVALFISRFEEKLLKRQFAWRNEERKTAQEVDTLTQDFRLKHFPEGAYLCSDSLRWSDADVLRHVCLHGKFQREGPWGTVHVPDESTEALLRSLSFKYQHQCRIFYQPLIQLLTRQFSCVGRVQLGTMMQQQSDQRTPSQGRVVEFVGAFDPSSQFLCGVFCSFR